MLSYKTEERKLKICAIPDANAQVNSHTASQAYHTLYNNTQSTGGGDGLTSPEDVSEASGSSARNSSFSLSIVGTGNNSVSAAAMYTGGSFDVTSAAVNNQSIGYTGISSLDR